MAGEHIEVLGSVFSVDMPSAHDAARIRAQWARCMAPAGATAVSEVTYGIQDDADQRDYALASALTLAGIARAAGSRLMLHAAGVADPETGRVAVLVAPSGTGKTTAAHRLCAAGFGYVTDETVSIGADDDVLPYPKPLSVVIAGDSPHHKSQHGPDELGLAPCPAHPRAALFVLLDRARDTSEADTGAAPKLEPLPLLDALMALIPQTSALPAMSRPLQTLAGTVQRAGGVWRMRYQEIEDTADLLGAALRSRPAEPVDMAVFAPLENSVPQRSGADSANADDIPAESPQLDDETHVMRAPYLDAIAVDDEILVLIGNRPIRLSGVGTTLWSHSDRPRSLRRLLELCVAEHGDHPRAAELVRDAVTELLGHRILRPAVAESDQSRHVRPAAAPTPRAAR